MPDEIPDYDIAMTIRYHEDKNVRKHVALAHMPCYASFPLDGIGKAYDHVRKEVTSAMPEDIIQWEKNDWAIGIPLTIGDKYTYQILKDYESKVNREKINKEFKEKC